MSFSFSGGKAVVESQTKHDDLKDIKDNIILIGSSTNKEISIKVCVNGCFCLFVCFSKPVSRPVSDYFNWSTCQCVVAQALSATE